MTQPASHNHDHLGDTLAAVGVRATGGATWRWQWVWPTAEAAPRS